MQFILSFCFITFTGELIGMDYLNSQNNQALLPMIPDEDEGDDEGEDVGCREEEGLEDPTQPPPEVSASPASSRQSTTASTTRRATSKGIFNFSFVNFDYGIFIITS